MPLGMEVGIGPGDVVLVMDPVPFTEMGTRAPSFRPMFIVAKRLDGSGYALVRRYLDPGDIVLDGDPAPPTERGTAAPTFPPTLL